jgi:glutaredoxin 3
MANPEIIVYSISHCPMCSGVKEYLKEKGLEFVERNVEDDAEARAEFDKLGFRGTPVTVIDGKPVLGFDRAKLDESLGAA